MGDPCDFSDKTPDGTLVGEGTVEDEVPDNLEEEYNDIHSTLDQLDSCLDALEQQNDSLFSKLQQLLDDSIATRTELEQQNSSSQNEKFSDLVLSPGEVLEGSAVPCASTGVGSVRLSSSSSGTGPVEQPQTIAAAGTSQPEVEMLNAAETVQTELPGSTGADDIKYQLHHEWEGQ